MRWYLWFLSSVAVAAYFALTFTHVFFDGSEYIPLIILFFLYCGYCAEQNGLGAGWHIALVIIIYLFCCYNAEAMGPHKSEIGVAAFLIIEIFYFIWLISKNHKIRSSIEYYIKEHISTLAVKFRQCRDEDSYGIQRISGQWNEEKNYFLRYVVGIEKITHLEYRFFDECFNVELCKFEGKHAQDNFSSHEKRIENGVDYENFVARILSKKYPEAKIEKTPVTGDQGADLLVTTADGRRIAVQCKWYSSPVGNFAVQEVVAAIKYYYAAGGMVVTNTTFTKQARQLARANNILLCGNVSPKNDGALKLTEAD